jgi:hypothetical protein
LGGGKTWYGKKLLGKSEDSGGGIETFTSYGNRIDVSYNPKQGTCERCSAAFEAAYAAAFPEGPKPIATFRADNPADLERAKNLFSPEALKRFFGPGGGGIAELEDAIRDSGRLPEGEDPKGLSAEQARAAREDGHRP